MEANQKSFGIAEVILLFSLLPEYIFFWAKALCKTTFRTPSLRMGLMSFILFAGALAHISSDNNDFLY
jgi:hypothetical protein